MFFADRRRRSRRDPGVAATAPVRVRREEQTGGEPRGAVVAERRRARRPAEAHAVAVRVGAGPVGAAAQRGPDRGLRRAGPAAQGAVGRPARVARAARGRQGVQERPGGVVAVGAQGARQLGRGVVAAGRGDHPDHQPHGQADQGRPFHVPADRPVHVVGEPGGRGRRRRDRHPGQDEDVADASRAASAAAAAVRARHRPKTERLSSGTRCR